MYNKRRKKYRKKLIGILKLLMCSTLCLIAALTYEKISKNAEITDVIVSSGQEAEDSYEKNTEITNTFTASEVIEAIELSEAEETSETKDALQQEAFAGKPLEQKVMVKLSDMTLEEKIAQMFMITPEALTGYSQVTAAGDVTYQSLKKYPVGGIIYFSSNIIEPVQLQEMTKKVQTYAMEISGLPLFLGIDEEGGTVARIGKNETFQVEQFPDMWEIGESGDLEYAYYVGETIGSYLQDNGLNVDFAPDADVLTNPDNKVIGKRAFSDDALLTAEMSVQVMQGLEAENVYACMKHFPGHGGTAGDTHQGYAYTERTLDELRQEELIPFQYGIEQGISFIMVSHIALPNVTSDYIPASLSQDIVTDLLRNEMGYEGLVITDAMNMGAITSAYNSREAAVTAILAGVDIVLMPEDFQAAYQGVLDAVYEGVIQEKRIDESVQRILKIKMQMQN